MAMWLTREQQHFQMYPQTNKVQNKKGIKLLTKLSIFIYLPLATFTELAQTVVPAHDFNGD